MGKSFGYAISERGGGDGKEKEGEGKKEGGEKRNTH